MCRMAESTSNAVHQFETVIIANNCGKQSNRTTSTWWCQITRRAQPRWNYWTRGLTKGISWKHGEAFRQFSLVCSILPILRPKAHSIIMYFLHPQDSHCFTQTVWNVVWASSKCIGSCVNSRPDYADSTTAKDASPMASMPISAFGIPNPISWWQRSASTSATRRIRIWEKYWMESFRRPSFAVKLLTIEKAKEINSVPLVDWSSESHEKSKIKKDFESIKKKSTHFGCFVLAALRAHSSCGTHFTF